MDQAISSALLYHAGAWVQSQALTHRIFDGQSDTWTSFSLNTLVFPCLYRYNSSPCGLPFYQCSKFSVALCDAMLFPLAALKTVRLRMPQLVSVWSSVTPQMQTQDSPKYLRTKYSNMIFYTLTFRHEFWIKG